MGTNIATCRHPKASRESRTICFSGPIEGAKEDPRAHGNIRVIETCKTCGCTRASNVNQQFHETGPWSAEAGT